MKIKIVVINGIKIMMKLKGDDSSIAIWNDYDPDDDMANADEHFNGNADEMLEEFEVLCEYARQEGE